MTQRDEATPLAGHSAQVKACCAATYSSDLVGMLLGDSYHPGGPALTRKLCAAIGLSAGEHVLDVASGRGATALMLASIYDVTVDGLDLVAANTSLASGAAAAAALTDWVRFHTGDAERLPFDDAGFNAVVCECAFCTFPDKATAAAEFARVLRPGGRLGLTDVVVDRARLPEELTSLASWVACIADARSMQEYVQIIESAGLCVRHVERHDAAVVRMVEQIRARIDVLKMTSRSQAEALGLDFDSARSLLDSANAAIANGTMGYAMLVAEKPA